MLAYVTEINLRDKYVRTTFNGEKRTFVFDGTTFHLVDALKVAAESIEAQVVAMLLATVQHIDFVESPDFVSQILDKFGENEK